MPRSIKYFIHMHVSINHSFLMFKERTIYIHSVEKVKIFEEIILFNLGQKIMEPRWIKGTFFIRFRIRSCRKIRSGLQLFKNPDQIGNSTKIHQAWSRSNPPEKISNWMESVWNQNNRTLNIRLQSVYTSSWLEKVFIHIFKYASNL